jgi:membrane-associated phospholipid phosphatase
MLLAAGGFAAVAAAVWFAAFQTATGERADARVLAHALAPIDSHRYALADVAVHLADPVPFALLAAGLVWLAHARGGRWPACAVAAALLAATTTAEMLKQLTAEQRDFSPVPYAHIAAASWPSGHTTAAATLALCLVAVAPAPRRPLAAAAGAAFTLVIAAGVLVRGSHFPSDVLGALCVATASTLISFAALSASRARRTASASP